MQPRRCASLLLLRRLLRGAILPLAALLAVATACFDESTYQGGGRRDIGGEIVRQDASTGEEPDEDAGLEELDSGDTNDTGSDSGGVVLDPDASLG